MIIDVDTINDWLKYQRSSYQTFMNLEKYFLDI